MEIVVPNTYQGGVDLPPEEEEEIGADDDEIDEDHDHDDDEEEEEGEEDGAVEGAAPTIDFDDGDAMWVDAEDDMNVDRRTEDQSEGDDGDHDLGVGADGVRQRNDSDGLFDLTNDDIEEEEEDEEDESEEEDEDDGAYEFIEEFGEQPDDGDEGTHHEIPLHSATFRSIQRNLMALDNHMHHHLHSEPIARVAMPNEISLLHPLLINPSRNQPGDLRIGMPPRRSRETIRRRVPGLLNGLGSFHPDNVAEVMEEILSRAQRMGSNGEVFVEVPDTFLTGTAHQELRGRLIGAERAVLAIPEPPPISDVLASAQSLLVTGSMERWAQEAMLLYGTTALETAMKVSDALLDRLVPLAEQEVERKRLIQEKLNEEKAREEAQRRAEEEKRRNEEEQRLTEEKRRAEEQEAEKREAERLAAEQEGAIAGPSQITPDAAPSNSATEVAAAAVPTQPATEEQVIVTVFGNEYNITGTGIDPTFLAALPEDLQEEIIREHLREQRLSRPPVQPSSDIGPEFLSVLPEELRFEVLAQERASGSSAAGEATTGQGSGLHGFPPSFPTPFGQPPFMESSVPYISELTNSLLRGSTDASDRVRHLFQPAHISITGGFRPAKKASSGSKATRREPIQLVEKPGLMNLLRLLFVPEPPKKQVILKILVNFCENSKSRTDLMVLLLTMLAEGSVEVSTVDKGLSQLSIKAKMKQTTPKKGGGAPSAAAQPSPLPPSASISLGSLESIPHLLAQRSLEALIHLVELNQRMAQFFVVEDESFSQLNSKPSKPVTPKRAKGKEKPQPTSPSYPLISVLLLLEKPLFRSNPRLMEQLMHLLAIILKSLAILKEKADQGAQGSTGGPSTAPAASGTVAVAGPSTATGTNVEAPVASSSSTAPVESVGQPSTAAQRDDAILASIPESYLRSVIDVLTAGECTSRTFQNIISVIRHLSRADRNLELFTKKLRESAQQLADHMLQDLERLQSALATTSTAGVPDETIVDTFSSPTSHQSKLLRIFKTIDFVYSKTPSKPTGEKGASEPPVSFDGQALMGIYDGLVLAQLWTKLGVCLAAINDSPELISIATILLPTIESFMVVSKPYVLTLEHRSASGTGSSAKTHANEDHFVKFTETHRKLLNIMVRNNPSLMSGSFALLVQNPKMLEFDNKRTYFNQQLHKKTNRIHSGSLPITVRRQYVFEDSYNHLRDKSGDDVKYGKLNVRFKDEEGVDAGGVTREWFSVLARQMFNPDYALFKSSAVDRVTYQPNRSSGVNPEHLSYFKFVGRIIGKAIYDGRLLDCYFTRSFYKCMLGIPVDYKDMEAIDPELYKSFEWILSNDITDVLDLTFSYETDEFGIHKVVDLKENGHSIPVTDTNKHEYVTLTAQQRLVVAIQQQINAFLAGFHEIIPRDLVKIMNEQELELLISGLPDIDIDDWKNNTEYQNYTPASPQIQWFWRAVRSFTQEERAKLIQFATGTSKIPLEGFAHIQGSNGIQKFQIHKDFSSTLRLPSAHTCFNQIDLPQYESYEQLRSSLLTAISECGTGFGLA
ncbi:E3 ubiquitin-protein ligase/Putative upstream regulatory element binding protein [Polychytrium aggregatum]|uniref:E3 ubiquitin-protein ligase/Putative upstream regulatory element binding protein n=1 Tax=Polychytrium aggregatum TaxID=110093 RepID=UPI0022FEBA4A|nr:E3 ubiquitin-protein ligase/Putative upstream regulatory element binding protein [Polychytrium aggregatum]KAI9202105.1 E3 ubiquitin-protein ligase/Putative upstream regulatory element binding protein [Polychytrium aggregatum]